MRVISGIRRGKKLLAPEGLDTRPTLDRVKQKMFDCIQFEITGKTVLDLFAGSGQLGIEALSRGAAYCHLNDASKSVCEIIRRNLSECGFEKISSVTCNLYTDCVTILKNKKQTFSLVFLDPPYHTGKIDSAVQMLIDSGVLCPGALIVCEHATEEKLSLPDGVAVYKQKKCGEVSFTILQKEKTK